MNVPHSELGRLSRVVFLVLVIIVTFTMKTIFRCLSIHFAQGILGCGGVDFLDSLVRCGTLQGVSTIVPPLVVSTLLPFTFSCHSA